MTKETLSKMKEEVLECHKKGIDIGIIYDSENEIIDSISNLKLDTDSYILNKNSDIDNDDKTNENTEEVVLPPKKKITLKVKKSYSNLTSDS